MTQARKMQGSIKRSIDVVGSASGLLLLAPLLCVVALLVAIRLGRPVLFRQQRPGRGGRLFELVKFRSMRNACAEHFGTTSDAQRLTSFGNFLRCTSLDEVPTLWNVLRGDMSLVGPRPLLADYLTRYSVRQARRHEVRPGVTGWAQTNGRNAVGWEERFEMDVWYVDNFSLWLDAKILLRTVEKVFRREGINQPGQATVVEFTGTESLSDFDTVGMPVTPDVQSHGSVAAEANASLEAVDSSDSTADRKRQEIRSGS